MSEVKRYWPMRRTHLEMVPSPDGQWVSYDDFLALQRERDVLVEDLTRILNKQLLTQGVDGYKLVKIEQDAACPGQDRHGEVG